MKADAKVIPVCPQCGEEIKRVEIKPGWYAWACGCSNIVDGLRRTASVYAETFEQEALSLYTGKEEWDEVKDTDLTCWVLNVLEAIRDFKAWLTDEDYLNERIQERFQQVQDVRRRAILPGVLGNDA